MPPVASCEYVYKKSMKKSMEPFKGTVGRELSDCVLTCLRVGGTWAPMVEPVLYLALSSIVCVLNIVLYSWLGTVDGNGKGKGNGEGSDSPF